jgi:hypothetical protein
MKKFLCFILNLVTLLCVGQTPVTITSRATFNGDINSAWFIADVSSTQTRKVSGTTILQTAVKYTDTSGMLAPYARAFDYYRKGEADARYLQSFTESDPIWSAASANYYTKTQADARYLQSFTETDPVWTAASSNYYTKTAADARYLQSVTGSALDNVFSSNGLLKRTAAGTYSVITDNSSNWTTAYNKYVTAASFTGTNTKTLTLTLNDATTVTANFSDISGTGGSSTLATLTDVNITTIQDQQLLKYDNATSKWINFTPAYITQASALSTSTTSTQDGYFATIKLKDVTNPSHYLTIDDNEDLTANHSLHIVTGNADRTLTIGASASVSGANTGDQTITLTGPVTGTGTGSFATTIAANVVTLSNMATLAANSIIGNNTGSAATPIALTATQVKTLLALDQADNAPSIHNQYWVQTGAAFNVKSARIYDTIWAPGATFIANNWMDFPTTVPSGLGSGGVGVNAWVAYASSAGNWFSDATVASINYRNITGRMLWGNASTTSAMVLDSNTLYIRKSPWIASLKSGGTAPTASGTQVMVTADANGMFSFQSIPSGGVADGDKGDITVSSGVWSIDAATVSLTKMANLAANSIIGNNTGSAAAPIALTVTQVKTMLSLNNVENTAISTFAGSANVTTLGSITTGTWSATAIAETKGGTNQTTYTLGDILYASAANTLSKLAGNTTAVKQYLVMTGTGTVAAAPAWAAISAADVPTLNQNTTGTASNITGVLNATSHPALTGDVTTPSGSVATTIAAGAVTLAKQANLAANSIIGNNTGSAATPLALTVTQVRTMLSISNVENTALSTWTGSTSITTLGTISAGTWSATTIAEIRGGTGQSTYTLGDILYSSASNTLSKLSGNTTTTKKYLTQTGDGTNSAAPGWNTIAAADVPTLNQNTTGTAANITGVLNAASFPALTGDITTSAGSLATAIGANKVTSAMLRQGVATSIIGVTGGSTANEADIQATVDNQFLSRKSSTLAFNAFGGQASITAASAAINTTETILTSYTIPASQMIAGTTFRVTVYGTCTSTAANASNLRVRLGTAGTTSDAAVAVITPTAATTGTSVPFQASFLVTIRTTGSGTGTTAGSGWLNNNGTTGISAAADVVSTLTTTSALNTTVQNTISVTYSSAATTTTSTFQLAAIEIVKM